MLKNWVARINFASVCKRVPLVVLAIALSAFGISCYYACGLGADPISIFVDGQHALFRLTYGQITTINNVALVVLMLLLARRYFNIGTIISCVLTGPLIDLFETWLRTTFPADCTPLWIRIAMMAVGVLTLGVGAGLFVGAEMGVGPFDFPPLAIRDRTRIDLRWVRIALDALYMLVGWLMGGVAGAGTVAGILLTGPILVFVLKRVKDPFEKMCGPLLKNLEQGDMEQVEAK